MADRACAGSDFPRLMETLAAGMLTVRGVECVRQTMCCETPQKDKVGVERCLALLGARRDNADLHRELQEFLELHLSTRERVFQEMRSSEEERSLDLERRRKKPLVNGRRRVSHRFAAPPV